MMVRLLIALLWLIVLGGLAAAMRLPKVLDLYFKDTYVVVPRWRLIGLILLAFVLPLLAFTSAVFSAKRFFKTAFGGGSPGTVTPIGGR
jgi:hypothetical protein